MKRHHEPKIIWPASCIERGVFSRYSNELAASVQGRVMGTELGHENILAYATQFGNVLKET